MFELILKDFYTLITSLPIVFIYTLIGYSLKLVFQSIFFHTAHIPFHKHLLHSSFLFYCFSVLYITIFSRTPNNYSSPEFDLFISWQYSAQTKAFIIENFLMLLPLGGYITYFCKKNHAFVLSIFVCLCSSICIEIIQYTYRLGFFQLDDIVGNVIGGAIGSLLILILRSTKLFQSNV